MDKSTADLRAFWALDENISFLNHGSFGACPREVLAHQATLRARLESEPVAFFMREADLMFEAARAELGRFLGADPERLAFLPNATAGVNTVLRSVAPRLGPGDELLTTNHEYNACKNALEYVAGLAGARVVVAQVPFPLDDAAQVTAAILEAVTPRTRLALIDHVTSPTGLVLPIADIARGLAERGVELLVDGAHGPGMVPLDLLQLESAGVAYYTGNLHKWVCAPKGAAFLHVRADRLESTRPLSISHGANAELNGRSRFRVEFDWTGTDDPTAALCVPKALEVMGGMRSGGWGQVMAENRSKALAARQTLCEALNAQPPAPDGMIGSLAAVPLGPDFAPVAGQCGDALQDALYHRHRIEVPIVPWPAPLHRLVRVSAQLYNQPDEYQRLAAALQAERPR